MSHQELAKHLRAWRDRLTPASVGLPTSPLRRAPGLRREEVAHLAGLSVDYLARLEQGRAGNPSLSVTESLARTLRLSDDENAYLCQLVGHANPRGSGVNRHLTPGVQRVLDRIGDVPVMVLDAAWQLVALNPLCASLLGDFSREQGRGRNLLWRHFTGASSRIVSTAEQDSVFEIAAVADLRAATGRHPEDRQLQTLIADLRQESSRFEELWLSGAVARHVSTRKTVMHPDIGPLTLDCDVLTVEGNDLRIVLYTADPGSPDGRALKLLNTIGLQSFVEETC